MKKKFKMGRLFLIMVISFSASALSTDLLYDVLDESGFLPSIVQFEILDQKEDSRVKGENSPTLLQPKISPVIYFLEHSTLDQFSSFSMQASSSAQQSPVLRC